MKKMTMRIDDKQIEEMNFIIVMTAISKTNLIKKAIELLYKETKENETNLNLIKKIREKNL